MLIDIDTLPECVDTLKNQYMEKTEEIMKKQAAAIFSCTFDEIHPLRLRNKMH